MPHVEPCTLDNAPDAARDLLAATKSKFGKLLNIFATMAHQPEVLKGVATIDGGLQHDLPAKLRELAYYMASEINGCGYCTHYHRMAAKSAGVSDEQLAALPDHPDSDCFDDAEKAVLAYAASLTKSADVSDTEVAAVKKHLNDTQLVTLAATVALANFTNRFNHGLGIELP